MPLAGVASRGAGPGRDLSAVPLFRPPRVHVDHTPAADALYSVPPFSGPGGNESHSLPPGLPSPRYRAQPCRTEIHPAYIAKNLCVKAPSRQVRLDATMGGSPDEGAHEPDRGDQWTV
jgi:hypothetical protein